MSLFTTVRTISRVAPRLTFARPLVARYHERVLDHFERPRNAGSLPKEDPNVGTGIVGAPACGDVMKLQIRVDNNGRIIETAFKTFGCGSAQASSSLASEWIKGKTLDEVLEIKNTDIAHHLALPPVKLHCSMLAEDAIKAAVYDFKVKRDKLLKAAATTTTATAESSSSTSSSTQTKAHA